MHSPTPGSQLENNRSATSSISQEEVNARAGDGKIYLEENKAASKSRLQSDSDDRGSGTKLIKAVREEEQNFSESDDSGDNASEDDLRDRDLYAQVYLKHV